jgi:histo-blood group ABO system transferase
MSDPSMNKPRVAVLVPATQRYTVFVPPILESYEKFFLRDCSVEVIILTDLPEKVNARTLHIPHQKWPGVTIRKFHYLCQYAKELAEFDYIYMCDADMRVVAPVGREILGDLVATRHPGFYDKKPEEFTCERNPASTAYIPLTEGKVYVMGAFFGGRYQNMMAMAADRSAAIDADYANNIEAVWHDESHLNRYVFDHPPDVLLSPAYCYPEGRDLPFDPKILALDKDHEVVRSTGAQTWMIRGERLVQKVLRKAKSLAGCS